MTYSMFEEKNYNIASVKMCYFCPFYVGLELNSEPVSLCVGGCQFCIEYWRCNGNKLLTMLYEQVARKNKSEIKKQKS